MKIISYNVNGIRAAMTKGFTDWLQAANPDVICLQEIKATEEQIDKEAITQAGYPYQYYFSAQKKGYSGVAILSKTEPKNVVFGTGIDHMDFEGRNLRADFENLSVMSMYLPSGTNIERLDYKFKYMDDIQEYVTNLRKEIPNLVVCGDYNICHEAIDIHNPKGNEKTSGFLPEERAWLDGFMKTGMVDTFRHLVKEPDHYSWWSYRAGARGNNKGWRIDYCLATENLTSKIQNAFILPGAIHSDHCPIGVEIY
jgi:exodeoxyribonuclease III